MIRIVKRQKLWIALTAISVLLVGVRATLVSIQGSPYPTHAFCLQSNPWLIWSIVLSHGVVALAYFVIPLQLFGYALKGRSDQWPSSTTLLFSAFIFLCGLGHAIGLLTFFVPIYPTYAVVNVLTGLVSIGTAAMLPSAIRQVTAGVEYAKLKKDYDGMKVVVADLEIACIDMAKAVAVAPHVEALGRAQEKLDSVFTRCDRLAEQMALLMGAAEAKNVTYISSP